MGALLDAVPAGGADHTEHHRDLATAIEAVPGAYQPLDADLTAIAALSTTAYGRSLLALANQAALQAEAGGGGGSLTPGVDYPTSATVTLSSAQLVDLHNTPVTLVAAPGAGKWLDLHRYEVYYTYGTADYTTNDSGPVIYVGDAAASSAISVASWGSSRVVGSAGYLDAVLAADIVNGAMTVQPAGSVLSDGDGTLTVTVWYTIEDVP